MGKKDLEAKGNLDDLSSREKKRDLNLKRCAAEPPKCKTLALAGLDICLLCPVSSYYGKPSRGSSPFYFCSPPCLPFSSLSKFLSPIHFHFSPMTMTDCKYNKS
ncbi:hypothetical protein L6164_015852 [Bauhinia variegata]|uniref:Uncharacterized protein n=1 Tax=Bauhinia variegata TaxID=167791 RepID=A0ACB9NNP1_BAUVA|nr:hypothetical protein L6164_015852 [Bauhinia variegata]